MHGARNSPSCSSASSRHEPRRNSSPKASQALGQPGRLELVGQDGRHRHRQAVGDLEHRQVRAKDGVEEPLLAERVRAEPLDVRHVGMKDEREHAPDSRVGTLPPRACGGSVRLRPQHSQEVERLVEVALRLVAEGEVRRGDRRGEAVVEGLRESASPCARGPSRGRARPRAPGACAHGRRRRVVPPRSAAPGAPGTRLPCTRAGATGSRTSRRPRERASGGSASRRRRAAPPRRSRARSAPGSWMCSIVWRKTTASHGSE